MKSTSQNATSFRLFWTACVVACACLSASFLCAGQEPAAKADATATASSVAGPRSFDTPQKAADALIAAAEKFDVPGLVAILGPHSEDIVLTGEPPQDRQRAADFAAEAREKQTVSVEPKTGTRAFVVVGNENWPFPVPIVKRGEKWYFDAKAGRQELLYRRIGANELDVIAICHNY